MANAARSAYGLLTWAASIVAAGGGGGDRRVQGRRWCRSGGRPWWSPLRVQRNGRSPWSEHRGNQGSGPAPAAAFAPRAGGCSDSAASPAVAAPDGPGAAAGGVSSVGCELLRTRPRKTSSVAYASAPRYTEPRERARGNAVVPGARAQVVVTPATRRHSHGLCVTNVPHTADSTRAPPPRRSHHLRSHAYNGGPGRDAPPTAPGSPPH